MYCLLAGWTGIRPPGFHHTYNSDVFKQHPVRSQMASSILHFKTNDINVFFQSKQIEKDDNTKCIHSCVTLLIPILLKTVEKSFTPF